MRHFENLIIPLMSEQGRKRYIMQISPQRNKIALESAWLLSFGELKDRIATANAIRSICIFLLKTRDLSFLLLLQNLFSFIIESSQLYRLWCLPRCLSSWKHCIIILQYRNVLAINYDIIKYFEIHVCYIYILKSAIVHSILYFVKSCNMHCYFSLNYPEQWTFIELYIETTLSFKEWPGVV